MTALLFDGVDDDVRRERPLLDAALPLSFYLWQSERV